MTLYGIPNCNTVKKAKDWLTENKIAFEFYDFKKKGVSPEKLKEWFDIFGWEKVINKNGSTFKKLNEEERSAVNEPERARVFLMVNTSAIKRPIIEKNGKALAIGFDPETYRTKLG